ncbi:MAG: LuxR C-terminal-related transcriptional regulator [Anaerolineales bacterium]|jgi:predicted ATPase/DNA-binding CsgD family transcriptional regulator
MNTGDISAEEAYAEDLTWREQEVLALLSERLTNREIADRLHLAESTVKGYVVKILSKLYVKNRRQAVERAKALGLLEDDRRITVRSPINLPAEPTLFVGRRDELAEIKRLLGATRLLTLTGPGGMGKTRLALKAAESAAGDFKDGCFFVSLAPIHSVDHIIQTIAEGVKFPLATHEDPQHQLLRYLRNRQLLLVIDNFEHLLEGAGNISEILKAAPAVKILTTSRERLNLQSETMLVVGGMDSPCQIEAETALNYDAVSLFVQSAGKVRPEYVPTPSELGKIVEICQIVQGMPLAIELAAAWLHILNVDEIAEELKKGIDILSAEVRDAPERHRSIHTVFDHSWSLLAQTEQKIIMRLSVFRGGFTRHAARYVAGASLQHLKGLVNKSFLSHDPDSGRLEIHELLRQYIQEQLEKTLEASTSAKEAHAVFYAEFMEQRWGDLKGDRQILALTEIEADIENVRVAWRYYLDQRNVPKLKMFIHSFREVYWIRGWNHAGMELFADAVSALQGGEDEQSVILYALALAYQGYFMSWLGLSDQGYELAKESVKILEQLDHLEALAFAYESLSLNSYCLNRFMEETAGKNRLLEIATKLDDRWLLALALFEKSMVALRNEDYTEAERLAESSLILNQEIGNLIRSTLSLLALGHTAMAWGEYERASDCYLRILKISQETRFLWGIEKASKYLGKVALSMDKIVEAKTYLLQSLRITNEVGLVRDKLNLLYEYACLLVAQNNSEQAAELLGLVLQHPVSHQIRLGEGRIRDSAKGMLVKLEDELHSDAYAAALERGRELEMDEVIIELIGPNS